MRPSTSVRGVGGIGEVSIITSAEFAASTTTHPPRGRLTEAMTTIAFMPIARGRNSGTCGATRSYVPTSHQLGSFIPAIISRISRCRRSRIAASSGLTNSKGGRTSSVVEAIKRPSFSLSFNTSATIRRSRHLTELSEATRFKLLFELLLRFYVNGRVLQVRVPKRLKHLNVSRELELGQLAALRAPLLQPLHYLVERLPLPVATVASIIVCRQ